MDAEALGKKPVDRTWRDAERVDAVHNPDFETQKSYGKDDSGTLKEVRHGAKDSQRPDGIKINADGRIEIREVKNYHSFDTLKRNIAKQIKARRELFGEDVDITVVISPNFVIGDAERLQEYIEDDLGCKIEFPLK